MKRDTTPAPTTLLAPEAAMVIVKADSPRHAASLWMRLRRALGRVRAHDRSSP